MLRSPEGARLIALMIGALSTFLMFGGGFAGMVAWDLPGAAGGAIPGAFLLVRSDKMWTGNGPLSRDQRAGLVAGVLLVTGIVFDWLHFRWGAEF